MITNEKRIHLVLYKKRDADLIALSLCEDIKMGSLIKKALVSYVNNKKFKIEIPKQIPSISKDLVKKDVPVIFNLKNEEERNVVKFLDTCNPREKLNVIKMIVRSYFNTPLLLPFLQDNGKEIYKNIVEKQNSNDIISTSNDKELIEEIRELKELIKNKEIYNIDTQPTKINDNKEFDYNSVVDVKEAINEVNDDDDIFTNMMKGMLF